MDGGRLPGSFKRNERKLSIHIAEYLYQNGKVTGAYMLMANIYSDAHMLLEFFLEGVDGDGGGGRQTEK